MILSAANRKSSVGECVISRLCEGGPTATRRASRRSKDALVSGASLLDLTAMTGLEARGYRAVLRLVRSGRLAPARRERISPATVLLPARAA